MLRRLLFIVLAALVVSLAGCEVDRPEATELPPGGLQPTPPIAPTATGPVVAQTPQEEREPTATPEILPPTATPPVAEAEAEEAAVALMTALNGRDYVAIEEFMADEFLIGYWRSEGMAVDSEEAIRQLRENLLPQEGLLGYTLDPEEFPRVPDVDPWAIWGPDVEVMVIVYSEGWGPDGNGSAFLTIAEGPDGAPYWHGLVYAPEGIEDA